ncbi:NAD(P)-dependent oxidoreductase [Saprospiraceae bacterium]|nr:NAD(P)-dependent oxidoreductase [Saprospiraceae bacterium]
MKVLVTGATGFIGSHVVESLLKRKDINIITSSSNNTGVRLKKWYSQVKHVPFDFDRPLPDDIHSYFLNPDVLIHLAWSNLPNYSELIHFEKNLMPQYFFIKKMVESGLTNINITGTCFEYGKQEGACSTELLTNPNNPYALAKDTLRKFLQELVKVSPFNFKWIRLFYMYGEGQSKKSILSLLQSAIDNGDETFNMSGGEQLRDYMPVTEVAKFIVENALKADNSGIINCCSGKPISIRGLVDDYLKIHNKNIKLNLGYYPYTAHEPMAFWGKAE